MRGIPSRSWASDNFINVTRNDNLQISEIFRYRHEDKLRIPVSWLNDGIEDCIMGEDELDIWPTCEVLNQLRRVTDNTTCKKAFKCTQGLSEYVELDQLCDGKEDCIKETSVCHAARFTDRPFVSPLSFQGKLHSLHCLPGLESQSNLMNSCTEAIFKNPDFPTYGAKEKIKIQIPEGKINCEHLFGELYVYLSCLNKCLNIVCPLSPLKQESCSQDSFEKILSLSGSGTLTIVAKNRGKYHNNLFECKDPKCISYDKVCDLVNDCDDNSDENFCSNSFQCKKTKKYIYKNKKCDGIFDCKDYSDECNMDCGKNIISGYLLKLFAWIIGILAVSFNAFILKQLITDSHKTNSFATVNKILRIIISLGDFLTGLYLVLIAVFDMIIHGNKYCKIQLVWLSSDYCAFLGVLSTFGANVSLHSMACLSIFRVLSLKSIGAHLEKYHKIGIAFVINLVVWMSAIIALIPLVDSLDDFFVNGLTYNEDINLFFGAVSKRTHIEVLRAYYGKILKYYLSWNEIGRLVNDMFTNNYGEIRRDKIHFYGNDGVCVFKYFVKIDDPQFIFVWIILALNLTSTFIITLCYIIIFVVANNTAKKVRNMLANDKRVKDNKADRLQRSITRIILTDLVCWIPFLLTCLLHTLRVLDATLFYPMFSIIVLPINSVVNPIIYDDSILKKAAQIFDFVAAKFSGFSLKSPIRDNSNTDDIEVHRPDQICDSIADQ